MSGMTKYYIEEIKQKINVGDTVRWRDLYNPGKSQGEVDRYTEGKVLQKYKHFCQTDKGSIQWGLIAGYLYHINQRAVAK